MSIESTARYNKRDAALSIITLFRQRLGHVRSSAQLNCVIAETCERVSDLQSGPGDRPYRARTICQLATLLRRGGWIAQAQELVHSTFAQNAADAFLQTEQVMCALALGNWDAAERLLHSAHANGMTAEPMYAALITAYGRIGRIGDSRRIFKLASEHQRAGNHVHSAIVAAYLRAGLLARARRAVRAAEVAGVRDVSLYRAAIAANIRARRFREAARLCRRAKAAGVMTDRLRREMRRLVRRERELAAATRNAHDPRRIAFQAADTHVDALHEPSTR